jgi:hypothetical protein
MMKGVKGGIHDRIRSSGESGLPQRQPHEEDRHGQQQHHRPQQRLGVAGRLAEAPMAAKAAAYIR